MSLTVTDLRTRRAETWEKAKAFLDERRDTESGCLSAEDDTAYARMEAEIDTLTNEIARAERATRFEADMARAQTTPLTSMPGMNRDDTAGREVKTGRAADSYKRAFWDAMRLNASPMEVRNALYMATLTASRFEPKIKAFYERLIGKGKPFKVAINACMHKLLRILNARVRDYLQSDELQSA